MARASSASPFPGCSKIFCGARFEGFQSLMPYNVSAAASVMLPQKDRRNSTGTGWRDSTRSSCHFYTVATLRLLAFGDVARSRVAGPTQDRLQEHLMTDGNTKNKKKDKKKNKSDCTADSIEEENSMSNLYFHP